MRLFALVLTLAAVVQLNGLVAVAETPVLEKKFAPLPALPVSDSDGFSLLNKEQEGLNPEGIEEKALSKMKSKSRSNAMNANCKLTGRYRTCF